MEHHLLVFITSVFKSLLQLLKDIIITEVQNGNELTFLLSSIVNEFG